MDKINDYVYTGESECGQLQIWCKIDVIDNIKYLKLQYRGSEGKVIGGTQDYPVSHIKMLNNQISSYIYKTKYPHININNARR